MSSPKPPAAETLREADRKHVTDFLAEQANYNSQATVERKESDLRALAEWMDSNGFGEFSDVTPRDFKHYIRDVINDGYSASTARNRHYSAKTFYQWMENEGVGDIPSGFDITERLSKGQIKTMNGKSEKEKQSFDFYLKKEDVDKIIENAPHPKVKYQLLIRLMWETGLRAGEAARVRLKNIHWEDHGITVKTLKSDGDRRTVWHSRSLGVLLRTYVHAGERDSAYSANTSPYLFAMDKANHITPHRVNKIVKKGAKRAGLQETMYEDKRGFKRVKVTSHVLRHSYAVHCVKDGMDIQTLRKLMGHSDIAVTQRYLRFRNEDLKNKARRYGPGGN